MPVWFRQWFNRPRTIQIGGRPFVSEGLTQRIWDDIYHFTLTIRWPTFFGLAAAGFLALNAMFGMLYQLGDHAIANQFPNNFAGAFFFSVETLATVATMWPYTVCGCMSP